MLAFRSAPVNAAFDLGSPAVGASQQSLSTIQRPAPYLYDSP
jgi:hypothetical protein